jgi:DNA-binding transcriptional LysR family regulator
MDYNLYPVFMEIMRHRSVSRAATALGLTQPAVSNALGRLRFQLDDPLFIRSKNGMIPTQLAVDVAPRVERAMGELKNITLHGPSELPALSEIKRTFVISMSDLEECLFLTELVRTLAEKASGITLEVHTYDANTALEELQLKRSDIIIAFVATALKGVVSHDLVHQDFVCITSTGNRQVSSRLSLGDYLEADHIIVAPDQKGRHGVIDDQLAKLDRRRNVVLGVPHFLLGCQMAAETDYLLTIPRRLAERASKFYPIVIRELPFKSPGFTIGIHWHRALQDDPSHLKFRELIIEMFQE